MDTRVLMHYRNGETEICKASRTDYAHSYWCRVYEDGRESKRDVMAWMPLPDWNAAKATTAAESPLDPERVRQALLAAGYISLAQQRKNSPWELLAGYPDFDDEEGPWSYSALAKEHAVGTIVTAMAESPVIAGAVRALLEQQSQEEGSNDV